MLIWKIVSGINLKINIKEINTIKQAVTIFKVNNSIKCIIVISVSCTTVIK